VLRELFGRIAMMETLFSRNGTVTETSMVKDRIILKPVGEQAFRSRIEQYSQCYIQRAGKNGDLVLKQTIHPWMPLPPCWKHLRSTSSPRLRACERACLHG